jgi:acetyl-CoA C-acetyltransferase
MDALRDGGVERKEIGAVYLGNFVGGVLTGQEVLAGMVAEALGLPNIPCTKVEGACASGGIAFRHAYLSVAFGICDVALVVGVEKMSHASTASVTSALNCAMDNLRDAPSGLSYPGFFGLVWRLHQERYGTSRKHVSSVVIKNKRNGLANPLAHMGREITEEIISGAPLIADPLTLFDCCPISDGAAAAVLIAADRAKGRGNLPIEILATVQTRGAIGIGGHDNLCSFDATVSAATQAYELAGIGPKEVDFVELHDCFSIAEIVDSEDLGIVPRGEGGYWALEGRTAIGGDIPINPSGGLLAKGHPVGATGVGQIYETVLQLRGRHPNQVRDAAIGLTHNLGGTGVACTLNILRRSDA